jgi:tetratricopeptide (TPR) repeat protein
MTVPDFLQPWIGSSTEAAVLFYAVVGGLLLGFLLGLWVLCGRGPRRRRAFRRARLLLGQGAWEPALAIVQELRRRSPPSRWHDQLRRTEGECYRTAAEEALRDKHYEAALEHSLKAAEHLSRNPDRAAAQAKVRADVVEAMLAEVRRLLGSQAPAAPDAVQKLIARSLLVRPVAEAYFWQAIAHLRDGKVEPAVAALLKARGGEDLTPLTPFLDPALYLGAVLLREGRAEEALRYLAEANRLDAGCPLVTWQLGAAMIAAGGDTAIAVRALQRAVGPRGLLQWVKTPQRVWVEAFPERASFVRRLGSQHPFRCPVFGADVHLMIRQALISLGQGYYRQGNFEEAAGVFDKALQEGAPSLPVLRGLGLALARLERFDQAFKHLRTAHELEDPKNYLTAGYLALCGAMGKPTQAEDKLRNVLWAVRLVSRFTVLQNAEWANLLGRIFAEARSIGLSVPREDQERLCETLASVDATDPAAAGAYGALVAALEGRGQRTEDRGQKTGEGSSLSSVLCPLSSTFRPEYAWLYCRAAQQHGTSSDQDLELFALTFATEAQARPFFEQRQWDFEEVEWTYLRRCAQRQPGEFPPTLGPNYPPRGERLLLARSEALEQRLDGEGAVTAAETLVLLAPQNTTALDRLAQLVFRAGDLDRAVALLENWHLLAPQDPLPYVRRAVIEQQRGHGARRAHAVQRALELARGPARAEIAFLGARLALHDWFTAREPKEGDGSRNGELATSPSAEPPAKLVLQLLEECLREDPRHADAQWCLAAVCAMWDQSERLAAQSPSLRLLEEQGPPVNARFSFVGAVSHLAAGHSAWAVESAVAAARQHPEWSAECDYLQGWAALLQRDRSAAARALEHPARDAATPSNGHAQALLAKTAFEQGAFGEAIIRWQALDPARRGKWGIDDPLRSTLFLKGLEDFRQGRFEEAALNLREAGRLGLRDRRLGPLLTLALVKAGLRFLYAQG